MCKNITLLRFAEADTVGWLTVEGFETSSIGFLSLRLVHKICELMFLFLFLGRQASRGALAFILITHRYILIFPVMIPILSICYVGAKTPSRQTASHGFRN